MIHTIRRCFLQSSFKRDMRERVKQRLTTDEISRRSSRAFSIPMQRSAMQCLGLHQYLYRCNASTNANTVPASTTDPAGCACAYACAWKAGRKRTCTESLTPSLPAANVPLLPLANRGSDTRLISVAIADEGYMPSLVAI